METAANNSVNEIFEGSPIATLNGARLCAIVQDNIYVNNKACIITAMELYERTVMLPISLWVKKRRWIGHVNRMPLTSIPRVAMCWTPAGNRRRGRPKDT